MIIIHAMNGFTLPRFLLPALKRRLEVMPAVVVTGARQTGKSTLVQHLLEEPRKWYSLDDLETQGELTRDPSLILDERSAITIDEIQRLPELLHQIKYSIDQDRSPGRFLLTGSTNLLLMKEVSESLAGRAAYLVCRSMTRSEQRGFGQCGLWEHFATTEASEWEEIIDTANRQEEDWISLALRGGFPTPAVHMSDAEARAIWFDGYVSTYLERDLLQLSNIANLPDFRRLMRATCLRTGQLVNQTELGRDIGLTQSTVHRYLNLLEVSHLLLRVPAFAVNRTKRLVKSPKLFWGDTGLCLHLSGKTVPEGPHLENLVLNDILTWSDGATGPCEVSYWRTVSGEEVDFVIETPSGLLPIEVKSSRKVGLSDARGLRSFRTEYAGVAKPGLLIYTGDTTYWLAPDVLVVPWWRVM